MGPALIIASTSTLLAWLLAFAVLGRLRRCETGPTTSAGRVSIIIPARDEAERLPALLRSIAVQSVRPGEVLVVDDHSTDATAAIAADLGARVLPAGELPDGWRGKAHACQCGADAARGDWLLFLDADTWFEPDGLESILAAFEAQGGGVLSVGPYHVVPRWHEQFSLYFNLVMTAGMGAFTPLDRTPEGLFGPMLLLERSLYNKAGGHAAVRGEVLENLHMAARLRDPAVPVNCRVGQGTLSFRMYPDGMESVIDGWAKAFADGAGVTALPVLLIIILWLSGAVSAAILLACAPGFLTGVLYAAYTVQLLALMRRIGSFKPWIALIYPIPLFFFFTVFFLSVYRGRRTAAWKGRVIHHAA